MIESLRETDVLINTYWVRFDHKLFTHQAAVANTQAMFDAAKHAGVRRIVHVSITNPDINSDLPYFLGKAELEQALVSLGLSYCILRPTVLFGKEDVLINNIAWALRHLPVLRVFGSGDYKLQPIYVDDLAAAAVEMATGTGNEVINAIGPQTFAYGEMVATIGQIWPDHWLPASDHGCSTGAGLLGVSVAGQSGPRCRYNPRRDQGAYARAAVRRCSSTGQDEADGLDCRP